MDTNLQNQLNNYSTKTSKKRYIFIGIFLLILSAFAYYFFFNNTTKKDDASVYNTKKATF